MQKDSLDMVLITYNCWICNFYGGDYICCGCKKSICDKCLFKVLTCKDYRVYSFIFIEDYCLDCFRK